MRFDVMTRSALFDALRLLPSSFLLLSSCMNHRCWLGINKHTQTTHTSQPRLGGKGSAPQSEAAPTAPSPPTTQTPAAVTPSSPSVEQQQQARPGGRSRQALVQRSKRTQEPQQQSQQQPQQMQEPIQAPIQEEHVAHQSKSRSRARLPQSGSLTLLLDAKRIPSFLGVDGKVISSPRRRISTGKFIQRLGPGQERRRRDSSRVGAENGLSSSGSNKPRTKPLL